MSLKNKQQKPNHIPDQITNAFHALEYKSYHLLGSSSHKNLLYNCDYDLNECLQINDTKKILNKMYKFFLNIFDKAYENEDYYILDFKNGIDEDGDAIRWTYADMKRGYKDGYSFQHCLLHDDNVIKIDLCFLFNHIIFTDITCMYEFVVSDSKIVSNDNVVADDLMDSAEDLIANNEYFKAIKRLYSKTLIHNESDENLLKIINSDYGILYKTIHSLNLVYEMIHQKFKPINNSLIYANLDDIILHASHITLSHFETYMYRLNTISKIMNINILSNALMLLMIEMRNYLNKHAKTLFEKPIHTKLKIFGGKIKVNTLHKMLNNSYAKKPKQNDDMDGYVIDKQLSGTRAQVYHHPTSNHLVVAHRGTSGAHDVVTDIKMMLGMKNNKRFKHAKQVTDDALKKYDTDNVSIIGHSLGSQLARESNINNHEMININPAILPNDFYKKKHNEVIIKSKYDPISALHDLKPSKNTIVVDNKSYNPLKQHSLDHTLGKMDANDDIEA